MSKIWDNNCGLIVFVSIIAMFITVFGGIFYGLNYSVDIKNQVYDRAEAALESHGITIVDGIMNSPVVIETTKNFSYFVNALPYDAKVYDIKSLDYYGEQYVAVFNSSYGLAYAPEYDSGFYWWVWG